MTKPARRCGAAVVITKPGSTGRPARAAFARFAAFDPTSDVSVALPSESQRSVGRGAGDVDGVTGRAAGTPISTEATSAGLIGAPLPHAAAIPKNRVSGVVIPHLPKTDI